MDSLTAAAQDVIARGMPLNTAARKHGVPRTTLRWRMAAMERELAGQRIISKAVRTALCLYDIHWPYQDQQSLEMAVQDAKQRYNVSHIIIGGDAADCESISRFARGPDTIPLNEEFELVVGGLGWLREQFPKASFVYIQGNHEKRLQAYLWNKATEIAALKGLTIPEQLELDRLQIRWVDNEKLKQESGLFYSFGKLSILHGHELGICPRVNPAHRYLERAKASLMVGHIHTTDEKYAKNIHNQTIACHCVGTLANMCPASRPQNDWVAGFAVVELDADGYYRVDNRKIIDGRIL